MATGGRIAGALGAYLKAQAQNAAVLVLLFIVAFAITGVPWWALTGFLCGLINLIPYFGSLIALGLAILLKWAVTNDWIQIAYVALAWLVIQIADGFLLSPRAAGRAGVNPFLSILLTIAAGFVFGPLGMLLAVPVTAIVLVVARAGRR